MIIGIVGLRLPPAWPHRSAARVLAERRELHAIPLSFFLAWLGAWVCVAVLQLLQAFHPSSLNKELMVSKSIACVKLDEFVFRTQNPSFSYQT
jgi:hypothetical protein